jgi:hypothetical protein
MPVGSEEGYSNAFPYEVVSGDDNLEDVDGFPWSHRRSE